MNNSWKDHLHFTRSERSGAIALSISIILILLSWLTFGYLTAPEPIDFSEFEAEVEAFYEQYEPEKNDYDNYAYRSKGSNKSYFTKEKSPQKSYKKPAVKLFPFNPNTASFSELTTLGLPKKTANTLINYREKGGKFYKKENLKNVYGLTDEDYLRLEDYIRIPAKAKQKKNNNIARKESPAKPTPPPVVDPFLFDPNTATFDDFVTLGLSERVAHTLINYREKGGKFFEKEDLQKIYNLQATDYNRLAPYINIAPQPEPAKVPEPQLVVEKIPEPAPTTVNININAATPEEWQQLRGIGPTYSKRIVKFRKALGGFHSIKQIGETYGMPDSVFQAIRPHLQLGATAIHTININTASADDLEAHPYLHWKKAKVILAYRGQHGPFQSVDDLANVKAISPELFQKIKPYLTVE